MLTRFLALALALSLTACGGDDVSSDEVENTGAPSSAFGQAMQGMGALKDMAEGMEDAANTPPADPVNHRVLAEMLPEEIEGMPQTETEGSSQSMGTGFSVSQRTATYQTEGEDGRITVEVMDLGGVQAAMMMGLPWAMGIEIDKESNSEYERTIQYQGHKGYRKYNSERQTGELSVLIEGRYVVKVSGRNVEDDLLETALQSVDTDRLADMKDEGRPSA